MDVVTLFSVPYAGGNSWAYRLLDAHLPAGVRLEGLELPGRGRRSREPLCSSLDELADDLFRQLRPRIGAGRYALFGHSMGALLVFLPDAADPEGGTARAGRDLSFRQRGAHGDDEARTPSAVETGVPRDAATYGRMPASQCCRTRICWKFFEPILRADFKAVETWRGSRCDEPLDVPLHVLIGRDDEVSEDRARGRGPRRRRDRCSCTCSTAIIFSFSGIGRRSDRSSIQSELAGPAAESPRVDLGYEESQFDS